LERECGLDIGGTCSKSAEALSVDARGLEAIVSGGLFGTWNHCAKCSAQVVLQRLFRHIEHAGVLSEVDDVADTREARERNFSNNKETY
jgi:hypothetical protein